MLNSSPFVISQINGLIQLILLIYVDLGVITHRNIHSQWNMNKGILGITDYMIMIIIGL